jgi:hypothetical protein
MGVAERRMAAPIRHSWSNEGPGYPSSRELSMIFDTRP